MRDNVVLAALELAFVKGQTDELEKWIASDCTYASEYGCRFLSSGKEILEMFKKVSVALSEAQMYYCVMRPLHELLHDGIAWQRKSCDTVLCLYQGSKERYVAIVLVFLDQGTGCIKHILLSRNEKIFNVKFAEKLEKGLMQDVRLSYWPGMTPNEDDDRYTLWHSAGILLSSYLSRQGYSVLGTKRLDSCLVYNCMLNLKKVSIHLVVFTPGNEKGLYVQIDRILSSRPPSCAEIMLFALVQVQRVHAGDGGEYDICSLMGGAKGISVLLQPIRNGEHWILANTSGGANRDIMRSLVYAFNHEALDVYDCILGKTPAVTYLDAPGIYFNSAVLTSLLFLHQRRGSMNLGYVRVATGVYAYVPYIVGYGYFQLEIDSRTQKIASINTIPFINIQENGAQIEADDADSCMYSNAPCLISVKPLSPLSDERFALELHFSDETVKKYVLPIASNDDEVVPYDCFVFTDHIWQTAHLQSSREPEYEYSGYPKRGPSVAFLNGFFLSALRCFWEGKEYSLPTHYRGVVASGAGFTIEALWKWKVKALNEDGETHLLEVLLSGDSFNYQGLSTFADYQGNRLMSLDLDFLDHFHDGLALVGKKGSGYGYVDRNMHIVVPMQYDYGENFSDALAMARRGDCWYRIDKAGRALPLIPNDSSMKYQKVGMYHDGLCKVSSMSLNFCDLAYHSDDSSLAGVWGYVDVHGNEVITPQYIYAFDFEDGMGLVCKGKWTTDERRDNSRADGKYWTKEALWGSIDIQGRTIIPFEFDEIEKLLGAEDVYKVHSGGWNDGHYGLIDTHGAWLVKPNFCYLGHECVDGLIVYANEDEYEDPPLGIYDIKAQKPLFDPQFCRCRFL